MTVSRHALWLTAGGVWLSVVVFGTLLFAWHEGQAGASLPAPRHWPEGSQVELSEQGATLVLFAHPRCPCTRATLGELEKLVARRPQGLTTWVVFYVPADADDAWTETDQWSSAVAICGRRVHCDLDGAEARRFAAVTSGQTLLYNAQRELLFDGGITLSRGHAGDNDGRTAIEMILDGATPDVVQTPVYGCPILSTTDQN